MGLPIYQVESFADKPFSGNPAAVVVMDAPRDDAWMQNVAREMNLSETAFVRRVGNRFSLRWFTPAAEVDLCGHATLASAHILWETGRLTPADAALFDTRSGTLIATLVEGGIEMDFPSLPEEPAGAPAGLVEALGAIPEYVGRSQFDYLVEVDSERTVRDLCPSFALLETVDARGIIVTATGSPEYDFVSRFFAPKVGINEDPVTGSAHCCLGPFWGARLKKTEMIGYQASARGGVVRVRVEGDRVRIGGTAITVLRGELVDA